MSYKLNAQQAACVAHGQGPLLVLAGAGSGKTGVIVNRITHLMQKGIKPAAICAVTFTNKAAREMRERVHQLTGKISRSLFIGTFHSLGLMILRENHQAAGLPENFLIVGQDDQLTLAGEVLLANGVDPQIFSDKNLLKAISDWKNSGEACEIFFADARWSYRLPQQSITDIVMQYCERLNTMNGLDFDDLILIPEKLLASRKEIRERYCQRFSHFLVDEFQDTNPLQFRFLRQLMDEPYNLCAVGDDDQSIYSWRGADTRIMLDFKTHFPAAQIIALEQNYRSAQYILDIANHLIAHNTARHNKKLHSMVKTPGHVNVFEAEDGIAEAEYVADTIVDYKLRHKIEYSSFCVLYRTNFQSRSFEEVFRQRNIPYHVSGSYQFYDRSEIKDILAYLRFFANHGDDRPLMRIVNLPKRGISEAALQRLAQYAQLNKKHLWDVLQEIELCEIEVNAATLTGILEFRDFVSRHAREFKQSGNLTKATQNLVDALELEREYSRQGHDPQKVSNKLLNIRELVRSIAEFEAGDRQIAMLDQDTERNLYTYLQFIALITADDKDRDNDIDRVQLMTIHQAKGLEFHTVFITGLEDGILPHQRALETEAEMPSGIEEERRLFYVAITRAKKHLCLTLARSRKLAAESAPSRFLEELPQHLLTWESATPQKANLAELEKMLLNY